MSTASIKALANVLSLTLMPAAGEPTDGYFNDIMIETVLQPDTPYVNCRYTATVKGQNVYSLSPSIGYDILHISFDGRVLSRATWNDASYAQDQWRDLFVRGAPLAWTNENLTRTSYLLVPTPQQGTSGAMPTATQAAVPENAQLLIYTEIRADPDLQHELFFTLELMAREFARDSDHTDHTFSETCHNLASLFWRLTALGPDGKRLEEDPAGDDTPPAKSTEGEAA